MADVLRSCAKTGCRWPAAASLSYRYATRQVWLLDLAAAPDPSLYDLCPHHADHLVVPKGWESVDDRSVQEVMVEPSAFDRAEEAARRRMTAVEPPPRHVAVARPSELVGAAAGRAGSAAGSGAHGRNRYAALVEQLPRLAAEQQAHPHEEEPVADAAPAPIVGAHPAGGPAAAAPAPVAAPAEAAPQVPAPQASAAEAPAPPAPAPRAETAQPPPPGPLADRGRSGPTTGAGRPPLPTRDLAPSAADDMTPAPAAVPTPAEPPAAGEEPLPGQLSIPVDDLDQTSGVVLQFDLAGARRRGKGNGVNP